MAVSYQAAPARSMLYCSLAELLSYPDEWVKSTWKHNQLDEQLLPQVNALPYANSIWGQYENSTNDGCTSAENINLESEYLRLFELSEPSDPCSLYGGIYSGNRQKVMEELLRYYRLSGLSTERASSRDLPDSIVTVMEFMQFLTFKESVSSDYQDKISICLTQRDILERHLTLWLPPLTAKLKEKSPIPFYNNVFQLLNYFVLAELHMLKSREI